MACVIIYGPPDMDTEWSANLKRHYGKQFVLHDWKPGIPMPDDTLILTSHKVGGAINIVEAVDAMWRVRAQSSIAQIKRTALQQGQRDAITILVEFLYERGLQDEQHGGAVHDDTHAPMDWINLVEDQIGKLANEGGDDSSIADTALIRARLVKIGALAIAGVDSIDRLTAAETTA